MDNCIKNSKSAPSKIGVWRMFDKIAKRYDFLNRLFSLRRDVAWRKKLARFIPKRQGLNILDLATGTADVLLTIEKQTQNIRIAVGLDMATKMLEIGRRKVRAKGASSKISLLQGDALHIPFKTNHFDAVTMAFGIRNVVKIERCLDEMNKVLKADGRALVLEFSLPENKFFQKVYLLYFRHILPKIGGMLSGDRNAYNYLNKSVESFPYGEAFCRLLEQSGFENVRAIPLTFGIATLYLGDKIY